VLRDGEFEFWPTYDPSSKVCNGGDKIHGLDKLGNIKQWECNRDDERRNEKGKEMLFPDLLQIRYKNSKVDDTLRARRSIGVHYTHGTMPDLRKKSDGKVVLTRNIMTHLKYVLKHLRSAILENMNVEAGLEVGSIRRIQGIGDGVLEFLEVETTFDIFQNILIPYLQYGVLTSSGYGVLIFFPLWSLLSACTDTPYLP
ncbi:hypothetical protein Tco_0845660, partial [Tanacetum coccineum]